MVLNLVLKNFKNICNNEYKYEDKFIIGGILRYIAITFIYDNFNTSI